MLVALTIVTLVTPWQLAAKFLGCKTQSHKNMLHYEYADDDGLVIATTFWCEAK